MRALPVGHSPTNLHKYCLEGLPVTWVVKSELSVLAMIKYKVCTEPAINWLICPLPARVTADPKQVRCVLGGHVQGTVCEHQHVSGRELRRLPGTLKPNSQLSRS